MFAGTSPLSLRRALQNSEVVMNKCWQTRNEQTQAAETGTARGIHKTNALADGHRLVTRLYDNDVTYSVNKPQASSVSAVTFSQAVTVTIDETFKHSSLARH